MDHRFTSIAAMAATSHGVFTTDVAREFGVSDRLRHEWLTAGWIERLGTRTFRFAGSPESWRMQLAAALGDLGPAAAVAGRSAAALHRLDGFEEGAVELWVPRACRRRARGELARSTARALIPGDVVTIDGLRCVTAERLILDSLLFGFTSAEIHNAIDCALRLRLVAERRVRRRVLDELASNAHDRRTLIDALVDTGGESALERRFLAIVRMAGLARPQLRRVYRSGSRTIARVDAEFPGGIVIEVAGHRTHSTRAERQHDAQRSTELTLLGNRVLTFTYDDVFGRPQWVVDVLRRLGVPLAA